MMFERFTREARFVVVAAQEEARALPGDHVEAPHLLLGAARAPGGVTGPVLRALGLGSEDLRAAIDACAAGGNADAAALASLGIDLDEVRRRVEAAFGEGALDRGGARGRRSRFHGGSLPFSPGAKKALELSVREALRLGHHHIGPEHVVLGAVRADDPAVEAVLRRRGRTPAEVRAAVLAALRDPGEAAG